MAKSVEYCIVNNDSGDDYVIPVKQLKDWELWLCSESAELGDDPPDYAKLIDGPLVVFKQWRFSYEYS